MMEKEQLHLIKGPTGILELKTYGFLQEYGINKENGINVESGIKQEDGINSENANAIAIICHPHPLHQGSMDNKVVTTIQRSFQKLGLKTVRFNFRGVGQSEGHYGEGKGEIEDLIAVCQWVWNQVRNLENQKENHNKNDKMNGRENSISLWLAGFSFGAAIATRLASEPKLLSSEINDINRDINIVGLLTIAPPVHYQDLWMLEYHLPSCPWIIIQGDKDEVVNFEEVETWAKGLTKSKKELQFIVMSDAGHFFHGRLIDLQKMIIQSIESISNPSIHFGEK